MQCELTNYQYTCWFIFKLFPYFLYKHLVYSHKHTLFPSGLWAVFPFLIPSPFSLIGVLSLCVCVCVCEYINMSILICVCVREIERNREREERVHACSQTIHIFNQHKKQTNKLGSLSAAVSFSFLSDCPPIPVWPPRYANHYVRISCWIITIHYPVLISGLIPHVHNRICGFFASLMWKVECSKYNLSLIEYRGVVWNVLAVLSSRILSADGDGWLKRIISPAISCPDCWMVDSYSATTKRLF